MQAVASARILRTAVLIVVVSGAAAAMFGFAVWHLLPYEALDATTPAQRFATWEGTMWGLGAAAFLFGLAALLNATDLYSPRLLEHALQQMDDARRGRTLYSELPSLPWLLPSIGVACVLVAVVGRWVAFG